MSSFVCFTGDCGRGGVGNGVQSDVGGGSGGDDAKCQLNLY